MMRKELFTNRFVLCLAVCTVLLLGQACTDLEPQFQDSTSLEATDGAFGGVSNASNSLDALYNGIENLNNQADEHALNEVSADNIAVLTRGVDWSDNGVWRSLHNHTWTPTHLYVLNAWNNRNQEILNATRLLDPASSASADIVAQASVIRALNMYMVLDFFGQVPFRGVNEGADVDPTVLSAQEAFDFILADLNSALSSGNLSTHGPDGTLFTAGEAFALFLRMKLNLNAEPFTGSSSAANMDAVIADANAIEALGFSLDTSANYFDIWNQAAGNSEVLFMLDTSTGQRVFLMLHPNQGGWNGFVTLTETFRLFGTENEAEDARLGLPGPEVNGLSVGYLRGQQLDGSGTPYNDRQGNPLVYENELLQSLEVNNERNGLRVVKYPQRNADGNPDPNNDFVFARFADVLLMRAEATMRGGSGGPAALADVNSVRTRAGAAPLGAIDLPELLNERARELNHEGWRRNDQVRFGTFSNTWELKTVQDDFRVLFPIPGTALATNPNLVQNPGY